MSNFARRLAGVTTLATLLTVSACAASPTTDDSGVASLSSGAPVAASTGATADSGRPQLRLDMSDEDKTRLWTLYEDCLVAHGVKVNPVDQPGAVGNGPGRRLDQSGEPKSAYTACKNKLPLQPPELDEDKNPNYAQQWNDNVRCLRRNGMKVHVTNPGEWTWDDNGVEPANESELEKACILEAFGAKK